jgi:3-phenylpropionate/trans-cinnamate dioxygenase ferredoxin reductase component
MPDRPRYVIIGASLAGATAAAALRSEGFDGQIVLIGEEHRMPYERPPLSKEYLRGEAGDGSPYLDVSGLSDDQAVELRTGAAAISLDTVDRSVTLAGGERVGYDALLLATGAEPRRLSIAGADLEGTHHLRTIDDADALRRRLRGKPRVVVVGGGWIGCEVAASAAQLGASVTIVELSAAPLIQTLGATLGSFYADLHAEHGIRLRMNRSIGHIEGDGRVERIVLADGERIDADLVVFGVGVAPRTALAEAAGLEVGNGILTSGCRHPRPACSRQGTWPTRSICATATGCESSTGRTPATRRRSPRGRCSASRRPSARCPTSSPTSTTSGWSTGAPRRPATSSSSGATCGAGSSSPSGCGTAGFRLP